MRTIDPKKATGKFHELWVKFAKFYEQGGDIENARTIFEKAIHVDFKNVNDLATLWCEYAEMELRLEYVYMHILIKLIIMLFIYLLSFLKKL
jgi:pre-mRNA-splicing factor SYF1